MHDNLHIIDADACERTTACEIRKFFERDIDLLLAEELRVNPGFASWIMSHFVLSDQLIYPAVTVNVSEFEDGSEADVVATFRTSGGLKHRLFIENKISAALMPNQLERYIARGQGELIRGKATDYSVLFFAPENYTKIRLPDSVKRLSFESAATHLKNTTNDIRSLYKASCLENAGAFSKSKRKYSNPTLIEPYIKSWWDAVYAMLDQEFPEFFIRNNTYPSSVFLAPSMAQQAKYIRVDLKGNRGEVDLAFTNLPIEKLQAAIRSIKFSPGIPVLNKRSSALRIDRLEPFRISDGLDVIKTKVRLAYAAACDLLLYWKENRIVFDAIIAQEYTKKTT